MKKLYIAMAAFLIFTGFAAAETVFVQQGGSSSSTAAVNENGTQWTASLNTTGGQNQVTEEEVGNVSVSEEGRTTFEGVIEAETPCHTLKQEVEKVGEGEFQMNIRTVKEDLDGQEVCVQQVVMIEYDASFQHDSEYSLEVMHNNETMENVSFSGESEDSGKEGSLLGSFLNWIRGLF